MLKFCLKIIFSVNLHTLIIMLVSKKNLFKNPALISTNKLYDMSPHLSSE